MTTNVSGSLVVPVRREVMPGGLQTPLVCNTGSPSLLCHSQNQVGWQASLKVTWSKLLLTHLRLLRALSILRLESQNGGWRFSNLSGPLFQCLTTAW